MGNVYDIAGNIIVGDNIVKTYTNPVVKAQAIADPCAVFDEGQFYVFSTGTNIAIFESPDLINYTRLTNAINSEDYATLGTLVNGTAKCWAPDVIKVDDLWLMYASIVPTSGNTTTNCHMCVFSAPNAKGPWKYRGEITNASSLGLNDCIDANVVREPDGKLYMFIGSSYGNYLIKLSDDGLSMDTAFTKVLIHPHSNTGSTDTRLEGAYCFWRNGYYYLFYSAGMYTKGGGYHLTVSRSASLQGPFLNQDGNSILEAANPGTTILSGNSAFDGPGHNGNIFIDSNNDYWVLYHAYPASESYRKLMLQKILWNESGWPYFENSAPTSGGNAPVF